MIEIGSDTVLHTFLLFCRIGGCLMFMPGFSSPRVPMQVRVFLAIAATLLVAPIMLPTVKAALAPLSPYARVDIIFSEVTKGVLIGLLGRFFYLALEFVSTMAASASGFTNLPGVPIEGAEPTPAFGVLITMTASVLFFLTDQHWEVLRALLASYGALPVTTGYSAQFGLVQMTDVLSQSFLLGLQIASPFIIYSIGINMLFGIANKLTPQIPVYFVSLPFVVMGGLLLLYFVITEFLTLFMQGFANWLVTG